MTTTTLEYNSTTISTAAARLAIAGIAVYQILLVVLIFVRPDLDPSWHTISEWAIGPYGWIMSGAFLISAASYAAVSHAEIATARGSGAHRTQYPPGLRHWRNRRRPVHDRSHAAALPAFDLGHSAPDFGHWPVGVGSIRLPADQPEPRVQESDMDKSAPRTALDLRSSTSGVSEFCALFGDLSCSPGTGRLRTGRKYRLASTLRVFYLHGLGRGLGLASNSVQQANFWSMKARR